MTKNNKRTKSYNKNKNSKSKSLYKLFFKTPLNKKVAISLILVSSISLFIGIISVISLNYVKSNIKDIKNKEIHINSEIYSLSMISNKTITLINLLDSCTSKHCLSDLYNKIEKNKSTFKKTVNNLYKNKLNFKTRSYIKKIKNSFYKFSNTKEIIVRKNEKKLKTQGIIENLYKRKDKILQDIESEIDSLTEIDSKNKNKIVYGSKEALINLSLKNQLYKLSDLINQYLTNTDNNKLNHIRVKYMATSKVLNNYLLLISNKIPSEKKKYIELIIKNLSNLNVLSIENEGIFHSRDKYLKVLKDGHQMNTKELQNYSLLNMQINLFVKYIESETNEILSVSKIIVDFSISIVIISIIISFLLAILFTILCTRAILKFKK